MFASALAYVFGWLFVCMAGAMLVPLAFALFLNEIVPIQAFLASAIVTAFLGGALILALKEEEQSVRRKENLFLLGTIWFVLPLIAALPFYFSKSPHNFLQAYFESVSGFTTTGATIFIDLSELPKSIIVWRAILQWSGGLTTLLTLAILLAPVIAADDLDGDFRKLKQGSGSRRGHLFQAVPIILPIYLSLTFACFLMLVFSRIPAFDAFCLALSTVSTGGFMPRPGGIALYGSTSAQLVLCLFMFLGSVSVIWISTILQNKSHKARQFKEPAWIGLSMLVFGLVLTAQLFLSSPEKDAAALYEAFALGLTTMSSFISTTGFIVSDQTKELVPYTIVVVLCIVGGGRLSTAGGLKFFRAAALLRQSFQELTQLIFPHGVRPENFSTEHMEGMMMRSVWANFALIVVSIWLLSIIIAITGLPLSASFLAAVSAISNIGAAYNLTQISDLTIAQSYAAMHPGAHVALCMGMILGRIEILALLSLLNISFWRS